MTPDRFDPHPDKPYGSCLACGAVVAKLADAIQHFRDNEGHTIRQENPSREERIQNYVRGIAYDAMGETIDKLFSLVETDHVTPEEIREGLAWTPDFRDAWDEAVAEES